MRSLASVTRVLAAAATATGLVLFVHVAVQQSYRQGANDPQIQMAEDAAAALHAGASARDLVAAGAVDMASSLDPWVMVVDGDDHPIAASVTLDGRTPVPPAGALAFARRTGGNRISWQPRPGVRSAIVAARVAPGDARVVVAGRSLREVEARERNLIVMTVLAWLGALVTCVTWAALTGGEAPRPAHA